MGKIICLMGKSAAGKDSIYKKLLEDRELNLRAVVPYTTRPIREGERNGVEYFFTDEDFYRQLKAQDRIIEERAYQTCQGLWRYFTADDGQLSDPGRNHIMIGTLEAYEGLRDYFGRDRLFPVMVELEDGARLQRALIRERAQENPRYEEMCRRFLADSVDFSDEKIEKAGIQERFFNDNLDRCAEAISRRIRETIRTEETARQKEMP